MKAGLMIAICLFFGFKVKCQNFQNGDLEGIVSGFATLPDFWQNVPIGDINCLSTQNGNFTPDLISLNSPGNTNIGVIGNPFSGITFVGGYFGGNILQFSQEGIMQTVEGLLVGTKYCISLRQTVIKSLFARDNSGSWAVYLDTTLAGVTVATQSYDSIGSVNLTWEARSISFTAKDTTHLIKFLPMDDDTNYTPSTTDTTGALYIGIDSIGLEALIDGLDEDSNGEAFKVFPNPNNGNFAIECNTNNKRTCSIINIRGEKVYSNMQHPLNNKINIDVSYLPKGVYTLKVFEDKMVGYSKVVIQ